MNKSENMFFRILDIFAHFVLLNAIWIICCIPIITIFPATTALYSVVKCWIAKGTYAGAVRLFFTAFKEKFKKSFIIGLLWILAGLILYFDLTILLQVEFTGSFLILILFIFTAILYVFVSVYSLLLLVQEELSILNILKKSLILSVSHLHYTLLFLIIIVAAIWMTYYFKIFLLIFGSVLAFILYYLFQKLEHTMSKGTSW